MPGIISSGYIYTVTLKKFIISWLLSSDSYFNLTEQESVVFYELICNNSQSEEKTHSIGSLISISGFILQYAVTLAICSFLRYSEEYVHFLMINVFIACEVFFKEMKDMPIKYSEN